MRLCHGYATVDTGMHVPRHRPVRSGIPFDIRNLGTSDAGQSITIYPDTSEIFFQNERRFSRRATNDRLLATRGKSFPLPPGIFINDINRCNNQQFSTETINKSPRRKDSIRNLSCVCALILRVFLTFSYTHGDAHNGYASFTLTVFRFFVLNAKRVKSAGKERSRKFFSRVITTPLSLLLVDGRQ